MSARPEDLRAVFVYGTLRPRNGQSGWAGVAEVAPASAGVVRGRLYYGPGYPYFVKDDTAGYVRGDVLLMDTRRATYEHMRRVELGAGYEEIEVDVLLGSGVTVRALAWHATHRSQQDYCTPDRYISDGDWHGTQRRQVEDYIHMQWQRDEEEAEDYDEYLGHDTVGEMRGER